MILTEEGRAVQPSVERRSIMSGMPNGWGWTDPSAIPPPGMYAQQRAGVQVNVHTALQVDAVFTAMRVISNAICKMGNPRAYSVALDGQNRPYRQWLANQPTVFTNTFGDLAQSTGITQTIISMGVFQEAFWYVLERDYTQRPSALQVLNPALMELKTNKVTGRLEYWYGSGTSRRQLANEDVIHIPFMMMPGAQRSLSSIEYAGPAFAVALAAMEYGHRWFSQGASPSYILTTDQKLGQAEVKRIAEKFLIEHSGLQAAHLPLVLDSGLKIQETQATPDRAQYLNTLEYARSVIAAWFGLPSHLMGGLNDRGNVWGRTVQEQGFQMVDYTLSGYVVRIEEAFSSLVPRGQFAHMNEAGIIRANSQDLAKEVLAERTAGTKTINDIRVERHQPPVPGGDDPLLPLNSNTSPPVGAVLADEAEDTDPHPPSLTDDGSGNQQ